MTPLEHVTRAKAAAFDRIDSLTDPVSLSSVLGPVAGIVREPTPADPTGYSSSRHEILIAEYRDGSRLRLRLKRTHIVEDWLARLTRATPPGREAGLLAEPLLAGVWDIFVRAHLAYAVEGSEVALLMVDHSDRLVPDVREPIPRSTEEGLLGALASLHARFWDAPVLSLPWLTRPECYAEILDPSKAGDEEALRGAPRSVRDGVTQGWREALRLLPAEVASRLTLPAENAWREWVDLPKTLLHGDTKVANFAFLPEGRVAAFDWTNMGAAPATVDLGWYLAVNGTRLARGKDALIARYREFLEERLGRALEPGLWDRMLDAGIYCGARMLLWSKAMGLREDTAFRREDWAWWVERLTRWSRR